MVKITYKDIYISATNCHNLPQIVSIGHKWQWLAQSVSVCLDTPQFVLFEYSCPSKNTEVFLSPFTQGLSESFETVKLSRRLSASLLETFNEHFTLGYFISFILVGNFHKRIATFIIKIIQIIIINKL